MFSDTTLIIINATSIIFLVMMLIALTTATRMKGGAGWAALVIVTTTVPVYLANLMRDLSAENFALFHYPAALLNLMCMPALWFFVRSQLDKSFRFTVRHLLHFIPSIVSCAAYIIYYSPMSAEQLEAERAFLEGGGENLPALINDVFLYSQMFIYFIACFRYIHKRKKFLKNNYSDTDYYTVKWVSSFVTAFGCLFLVVFVAYVIDPRTDVWLIPILNVLIMGYLVYTVIFHSTQAYLNRLPEIQPESPQPKEPPMSAEEMKVICDRVIDYLKSSQAYLQQDLSLAMLVKETGIPQKTLSRSINGYLKRNFFDLVNEMRVEEAKRRLMELKTDGYKIDSIYEECGFRTRSTFFIAFKKVEGETPAHWLKMNNT